MLYSLIWWRTRTIQREARWGDKPEEVSHWDEEQSANGETQYFTEERFAQGFAQYFCADPLIWEKGRDFLIASWNDLRFSIDVKDVDINPTKIPELPNNFGKSDIEDGVFEGS